MVLSSKRSREDSRHHLRRAQRTARPALALIHDACRVHGMAILEYLADVCPEAHLLPHDPLLRARARVFVEIYRNYVHDQFRDVFFLGKPIEGILAALEKLQRALPVERGFAAGEWSIADAAVAPSVVRLKLFLREGLGAFTEEDLQRLRDAMASEKFARFAQYVQDVSERPSFKKTWVSDERQLQVWGKHPGLRQRKTAAAASSGGTQA